MDSPEMMEGGGRGQEAEREGKAEIYKEKEIRNFVETQ